MSALPGLNCNNDFSPPVLLVSTRFQSNLLQPARVWSVFACAICGGDAADFRSVLQVGNRQIFCQKLKSINAGLALRSTSSQTDSYALCSVHFENILCGFQMSGVRFE